MALLMEMPARAQEQQQDSAQQPGDDGSGEAAQADPPSQVARIAVLAGNVSVEPASVNQFSAAEANYPLTTGDRVYADVGSNAELQTDQLAVRMGQQTDLTVTAMTDTLAQFGLASGSVHLRSFGLDPNATVELDTPNVAVTVLQAGDVRVDVDPDSDSTIVWLISGQVQVDGNGLQQVLQPGQRVRLSGSDPVAAQWLNAAVLDGLDRFSTDRDGMYESSVSSEGQYVDPETIGAEDLSANGSWETDPDEGPVWYPSGVAVGWQPYSCGRWAWVAPWGWTWVECEPWGFAPFHYGRWEHRGPRWGWIPGPPGVRPYYSPALVAFVGGPGLMSGGVGVTAWFPLGPHEVYVPWYHASPLYVNRVNVANIYNRNTVQVRTIYNQRTEASAYSGAGEHGYVNRSVGTIAMSQASFAAGKRVRTSEVHMSADDLAAAPVLPHPLVSPQRTMVVSAPAKAVPVRAARPTLTSHEESVRPAEAVAAQRPAEPSVREPAEPSVRAAEPTTPEHDAAPNARMPTAGAARAETEPAAPAQAIPAQTQRPLFNRAVPPPPRPSFDEQQKAIESTDPGRPLSPQQLNNLRENQPVGQPQQREAPHPAPRPAPAPHPAPPPADHKH